MKNRRVELLAPAGSYESFVAAINAGADAVYIGGSMFGARANANNLDEEAMLKAIDYAHIHGRSLYLTVNTLLKNSELEDELIRYLEKFYEQGLDAVIVQDVGVLRKIRNHFPDLPVHASTQMTITGPDGAKLMEDLGLTRVVTARELSLEEIREIHHKSSVEIESFVHGALCYCYSGQCLYSSLIGGRSGNRGRCAQPCRLPYDVLKEGKSINSRDEHYVLSPKDMCTLDIIPDMIEAGIFSFKIEGRMKKPEYVAGVVSIYRKYIDLYLKNGRKGYKVDQDDRNILMDLYNRGGFTNGYYGQHNGRQMISLSKPNHFGVPVGKITEKSNGKLRIALTEAINSQDVLEIQKAPGGSDTGRGRSGSGSCYEKNPNSANRKYNSSKKDLQSRSFGNDRGRASNLQVNDGSAGKPEEFTVKNSASAGSSIFIPVYNEHAFSIGQTVYRTRNEALLLDLRKRFIAPEVKEAISGRLMLSPGLPAELSVSMGGTDVTISGQVVETALSLPVDENKIRKQIMKTGSTPFVFSVLETDIEKHSFIPIQALNELRRNALDTLQDVLLKNYRRKPETGMDPYDFGISMAGARQALFEQESSPGGMELNAYIEQEPYFDELLSLPEIKNIYIDALILIEGFKDSARRFADEKLSRFAKLCHQQGKGCFLVLPHIFRKDIRELFEAHAVVINASGIDGFLIKNIEELAFLRENGFHQTVIADHNLYSFNREAVDFWHESGISHDTAPVELNSRELKERGCNNSELIVYGYLPMMVSAQCVKKTTQGCDHTPGELYLKDRYQKDFCVRNQCGCCYNTIYNCQPLVLIDNDREIRSLHPRGLRLNFTIEPSGSVKEIAQAFIDRFIYDRKPHAAFDNFTRGHFKRGIE